MQGRAVHGMSDVAGSSDARLLALTEFVGRIGRTSTLRELQQRYLDGIGLFVPRSVSGIYLHDPRTGLPEAFSARGVSDYYLSRYERMGRRRDPVLDQALTRRGAVDNLTLMSSEEWTDLPAYRDVFRLHAMTNVLIAPIVAGGEVSGTLNFARSDREGAFSRPERDLAEAIALLLGAVLPSARASMDAGRERDRLRQALELCGEAVVITDTTRAERTLNAAAQGVVRRVDDGEARFEELVVRAGGGSAAVEVSLTDGRTGALEIRSVPVSADASVTVSFLLLSGVEQESLPPVIRHLLSGREQDVVELAAEGLQDAQIARRLYLSPYTVKQHLKSAYAKLGVHSRVELARTVARHRAPGSSSG